MAATVVSLPLPNSNDAGGAAVVNPAEARKRRREILSLHRNSVTTPDTTASASVVVQQGTPQNKKARVECSKVITATTSSSDLPVVVSPSSVKKTTAAVVISKTTGKPKKPQMKYDPDVPMTKEEAAAWRREQRRKRNRESAAASRQRQRDRIVELEAEVEEWKAKFDEAMKRIQELEGQAGGAGNKSVVNPVFVPVPSQDEITSSLPEEISSVEQQQQQNEMEDEEQGINIQSPEELVEEVFKDTTIMMISPTHAPRSVSPTSSTTVDFSQVQAVKVISNVVGSSSSVSSSSSVEEHHQAGEEEEQSPQPSKMISRQAVKINTTDCGTSSLPLLPDEDSLLSPDQCRSADDDNNKTTTTIAPIDSKLFPRPTDEDTAPVPVTNMLAVPADNEDEFGEFLLDAVDWL